tara:strand:+ start:1061 stop:1873 length:813 start_codon:yes stop_codon:yes gene_type:complete
MNYENFPQSAAEERRRRREDEAPVGIEKATDMINNSTSIFPGSSWDSNNGQGSAERNKEEALNEMKGNAGISDNAGFKGLLNDKIGLPMIAAAGATVFTGDDNKSKLTNAVLAAGGASILQHLMSKKGVTETVETPSAALEEQNADNSGLGVGPGSDATGNDSPYYDFPLGDNITDPKVNQANNISGAFNEDLTFSQASNTGTGDTGENMQPTIFTPNNEQGVMNAHIINPGTSDSDANTYDAQFKTNNLLAAFKNKRIPQALANGELTL